MNGKNIIFKDGDDIAKMMELATVNRRNILKNLRKLLKNPSLQEKDMESVIKDGNAIRFADLSKKEKFSLTTFEVVKTYVNMFAVWSLALEALDGLKKTNLNLTSVVGQGVWALVIQAVVSSCLEFTGKFSENFNKFLPNYIQDGRLKTVLRKTHETQSLINLIEVEDETKKRLLKKIGKSAYYFNTIGLTKNDSLYYYIKRFVVSLFNQLEKSAIVSFKDEYNKSKNNGNGEIIAGIEAFVIKVFYAIISFTVQIGVPNMVEDYIQAVVSNFFKATNLQSAGVTAIWSALLTFVSQFNIYSKGLKGASNIAVRGRENINVHSVFNATKNSITGILNDLTSREFYQNAIVNGVGRAIGRMAFEYFFNSSLKPSSINTDEEKMLDAYYNGLRSFSQQVGKNKGSDAFKFILQQFEPILNGKSKLMANLSLADLSTKRNHVEQLLTFVKREKDAYQKAIDDMIAFLSNECIQTQNKDVKNLQENWLLSLYNAKKDLISLETNILDKNPFNVSQELEELKFLSKKLLGSVFGLSQITENLNKLGSVLYCYYENDENKSNTEIKNTINILGEKFSEKALINCLDSIKKGIDIRGLNAFGLKKSSLMTDSMNEDPYVRRKSTYQQPLNPIESYL
jgi:hypothetical protein